MPRSMWPIDIGPTTALTWVLLAACLPATGVHAIHPQPQADNWAAARFGPLVIASPNSSQMDVSYAGKLGDVYFNGFFEGLYMPDRMMGRADVDRQMGGEDGRRLQTVARPIRYNGGPVMAANPIPMYAIFYGQWTDGANNPTVKTITNALRHIGGSPWWQVNIAYTDSTGNSVGSSIRWANDPGHFMPAMASPGTYLHGVVQSYADARQKGVADPEAIYLILTSPEVYVSGFCTQFCGYHTSAFHSGKSIKWVVLGTPALSCSSGGAKCSGCTGCVPSFNSAVSPNDDPPGDAVVNTLAHELAELASNPLGNGWYDSQGNENADKCAWTYGDTEELANGAVYNVQWGPHKFLVQQNWRIPAQACGLTP